jgi:hypothetical protein
MTSTNYPIMGIQVAHLTGTFLLSVHRICMRLYGCGVFHFSAHRRRPRIERQDDFAAQSTLTSIGMRSKCVDTSTKYTRSGLQQPRPAIFRRAAGSGTRLLVNRLWRRCRRRSIGAERPSIKYSCACKCRGAQLGSRRIPKCGWLPRLLWHRAGKVSPVLWARGECGQRRHLYHNRAEQRDAVLFRNDDL